MEIKIEDPRTADVVAVVQRHLDMVNEVATPELIYTLDIDSMRRPGTTLFGIRDHGVLLGVCALKLLTVEHAELKSMHVISESRGKGAGDALLSHVLDFARSGGVKRVSLQTNSDQRILPARKLYEKWNFAYTEPFSDYPDLPENIFMTLVLT